MNKNILNEVNYMKYLLGYSRGKVISEQKNILLEQVKDNYDKIKTDLEVVYSTTLTKYGISGFNIMGTDADKKTSENYIGKPTTITFTPSRMLKNDDGQDIGGIYYVCSSPDDGIKPFNNKLRYQKQYQLSNTTDKTTVDDETLLRITFEDSLKNIGSNLCKLIEKVSKKEDITKSIQTITKNESSSNTTTTTPVKTTTTTTVKPTTPVKPTTTVKPTNIVAQNPIYDAPIIEVKKEGNLWKVKAFGSFPVNVEKSGLAKSFISDFTKKVFGDPVLQKTKGDVGITFAKIRGGASNYNGGAVLPDIKFDASNPKNYTTYTTIDKTKLDKNNYPGNLSINTELAKNRASNLFNEMKKMLPNLKGLAPDIFAEIQKNNPGTTPKINVNVNPSVEGFNVDTGGEQDKERDARLYPVPGQHVYMDLTVQIEPNKVKSVECMKGFTIIVTHSPHNCDFGQYNLYVNDVLIGMSDVSTETLGTSTKPTLAYGTNGVKLTKYTNNVLGQIYPDRSGVDGVRKDTFTIPGEAVSKFLEKSIKGEVRISAQEWKPERHTDKPFFTVKNAAGTVLLDNWSPAKQTPCTSEPCPKFDMVVINPCSDDPSSAILGNNYGKTA